MHILIDTESDVFEETVAILREHFTLSVGQAVNIAGTYGLEVEITGHGLVTLRRLFGDRLHEAPWTAPKMEERKP